MRKKRHSLKAPSSHSGHVFINKIIDILEKKALSPDVFSKDLKGWKKECNPFSSWRNRNVAHNDFLNSEEAIKEIHKFSTKFFYTDPAFIPIVYNSDNNFEEQKGTNLSPVEITNNQYYLQIISVSAKNRAEYLSDRADFYPVFTALVSAVFVFISYDTPGWVKYLFLFSSLLFFIISVYIRLTTRRQVAELKMMANVLDLADKQFPKPVSEKIVPLVKTKKHKLSVLSQLIQSFFGKN